MVTTPSPSLRAVLDELGPIVSVVTAPAGFDVGVGRPVIHDPLGDVPVEAGDVVLAVGTPMHGAAAVELVATAGAAGAAAVVLRVSAPAPDAAAPRRESTFVAFAGDQPAMAMHFLDFDDDGRPSLLFASRVARRR